MRSYSSNPLLLAAGWAGAAYLIAVGIQAIAGGRFEISLFAVGVALAGALYEPTRRYLREMLPRTSDGATAREAALLVHAACHLRLLQPVEVSPSYTGTVNAIV